ncbi:hypothetical protein DFQ04_0024 [Algoriphagus boseongensis]|uniref:Uncharacterized protein n=1 Tax=Algoriphagus boseongensis TaxID=1442587 RepID=A0A4R6T6K4_9BACT|nr:hypothetical protein [Algoriphagus boseongensis]TDQ18226.1 hypothetical protein DFQ04_0024 [Algoriphagus boseongensis]
MKSIIFQFITVIVFLSCNKNLKVDNSNENFRSESNDIEILDSTNIALHYKTKKFEVAIFPKEYKDFLPEKRFTPTKSEIEKAELALETKLKNINKEQINQSSSPIIDKNLHKYRRQYFGCIDDNGKKYLLINCFWSDRENSKGWLNGMIMVLDGGSYYWEIEYYIENDELKNLSINGYA